MFVNNGRDEEATEKAEFYSAKSYVTFSGHVRLYGEVDHGMMRRRIYDRAKGMCELCPVPHFVDWDAGEWIHPADSKGGKRCDGLCCCKWGCKPAHRKQHGREF